MSREEWRDIEGFPGYQVSDLGRVRSWHNNRYGPGDSFRILKPSVDKKTGYSKVSLWKNNNNYTKSIHRLVAITFIDNPESYRDVNHIDGDKLNNVVTNLEWCSPSENNKHAYRTGLIPPHKTQTRHVRIKETGEVFETLKDCAEAIDGHGKTISMCLNDGYNRSAHRGLHFEEISEEEYLKHRKPTRQPFLRNYQMEAVMKMFNGCILCGGVGSGKSRVGLYYWFMKNGGKIDEYGYRPMNNRQDLIIITTALKRDNSEWLGELANYILSPESEKNDINMNVNIIVDSWQNIKKYADVKDHMFLFDEDHLTGNGTWVKTFYKIAKNNDWVILSATPGDTYQDYIPVFVANGFYRNKTDFERQHIQWARYTKFPKIERYYDTGKLIKLRNQLLVDMDFERHTIPHHIDIYVKYDIQKYKEVCKDRWNPYKNQPIQNVSEFCQTLRRVVNTDESRIVALMEILDKTDRAIIFYNYTYELEMLRNLFWIDDNSVEPADYLNSFEVAEWNGQIHQPIPDSKRWVYLCQYNACEAWNCIKTDTIIFFSQNYSYKVMTQAAGRIDRLNSPYRDLYYYHLKSRSGIDLAISNALNRKKKFNERKFTKWE